MKSMIANIDTREFDLDVRTAFFRNGNHKIGSSNCSYSYDGTYICGQIQVNKSEVFYEIKPNGDSDITFEVWSRDPCKLGRNKDEYKQVKCKFDEFLPTLVNEYNKIWRNGFIRTSIMNYEDHKKYYPECYRKVPDMSAREYALEILNSQGKHEIQNSKFYFNQIQLSSHKSHS